MVKARIEPGPSAWRAGFVPTTTQDRDMLSFIVHVMVFQDKFIVYFVVFKVVSYFI